MGKVIILFRAMCQEEYERTLRLKTPDFSLKRFKYFALSLDFIKEKVLDGVFNNSKFKKEIVEFIQRIHSFPFPLHLIVHCFAGVSRSAAVGKFVSDALKLNFPQYEHLQIYNKKVYSSLRNAFYEGEVSYDQ